MSSGLRGKDKRELRALGHHLRPVVQIGQQGLSPAVVRAAAEALHRHELIKVKLLESAPLDRHEAARSLAEQCDAELVQVLGRTLLLFKERGEEGEPPTAALHGDVGGEGDRPAASLPKRAISQGALDEGRPVSERRDRKK